MRVSRPSSVGSAGLWLLAFALDLDFGPKTAIITISAAFVGPVRSPPFASRAAVVIDTRRAGRHEDHPVRLGSNAVSSSSWLVGAGWPLHLVCCCRYALTGRTCHRLSRHH